MVLITREERNKIFYSILMDGVITVKKEFGIEHAYIKVDNLKVWMLCKHLKSKEFLHEVFNWRHYYFSLTTSGVQYIKGALGISEAKVQPKTFAARAEQPEPERERPDRRRERPEGARDGERGTRGRGRGRGTFRGRGRGGFGGRGEEGEERRPRGNFRGRGGQDGESGNREAQDNTAGDNKPVQAADE